MLETFITLLPGNFNNLLAFYIFLAYTGQLDFDKLEEYQINSYFCRLRTPVFKSIANTFYFCLKSYWVNEQTYKYWNTINGHAKDVGVFSFLNQYMHDMNLDEEDLSHNDEDHEVDESTEDEDVFKDNDNISLDLIDYFKSIFSEYKSTNSNIELDELPRNIFENCEKFNKRKLCNNDPLSNGVVYKSNLKNHHPEVFKLLKQKNLTIRLETCIELEEESNLVKEYLKNCITTKSTLKIKYEDIEIIVLVDKFMLVWNNPSYQNKSLNISEKTYSVDIAYNIINFTLSNIKHIQKHYDGSNSQSSKFRNGKEFGPRKFPDFISYFENQNYEHNFEFFFCEISYGPFSSEENHTKEDFTKLFKFAVDSLNYDFIFLSKFRNFEEIFEIYQKFKVFLFHFHETRLDIYVMNREFWLLSKMEKLFYIELPIEKEQRRSVATNKLNDMIKKLNYLNINIKDNL